MASQAHAAAIAAAAKKEREREAAVQRARHSLAQLNLLLNLPLMREEEEILADYDW